MDRESSKNSDFVSEPFRSSPLLNKAHSVFSNKRPSVDEVLKTHVSLSGVFAVRRELASPAVDEGLLLMGSDVDESPGYEVVNRTEGYTARRLALRHASRLLAYRGNLKHSFPTDETTIIPEVVAAGEWGEKAGGVGGRGAISFRGRGTKRKKW